MPTTTRIGITRRSGGRVEAIRDYLTANGGLAASQVRAVSYGEEQNRQVRAGATGAEGRDNRRVALVIDYAGTGVVAPMQWSSGSAASTRLSFGSGAA